MQQRTRSAESLVLWILSAVLAAVFLVAGASKLIGVEPIGLQAAAMRGFPGWLRVITGSAEVIAAIALLVPRTSHVAAAMLALLMIPASFTQYISGQPGLYVPILLFFVLLLIAWRRSPDAVRAYYHRVAATPRPLLREGVAAGLIGAVCIAVWFFGVDLIAGRPFFTPATLGRALLRLLGPVPADQSTAVLVAAYTIFHVLAFIVVGIVAALVVHAAKREPSVLLGFVILFAAFEVGFYALVGMLQQASPLGQLAWYQVMLGNLIAALAMGTYLWRAHPQLREQFTHALQGR